MDCFGLLWREIGAKHTHARNADKQAETGVVNTFRFGLSSPNIVRAAAFVKIASARERQATSVPKKGKWGARNGENGAKVGSNVGQKTGYGGQRWVAEADAPRLLGSPIWKEATRSMKAARKAGATARWT